MTELPEIELARGTRVIADLHLDVSGRGEAQPRERFRVWLAEQRGVPALLILGDLFDAWIGPAHLALPAARGVVEGLAELAARGTAVHVLHGNRDFLLERRFEGASGARVHPAGMIGRTPRGDRILFVHGDELCTADHGYQRLRAVLRSRPVRRGVPLVPRWAGLWIARRLRRASVQALGYKPSEEKALQAPAARELAERHRCRTLVCGHAHEFRDELLPGEVRWLVLDAFGGPAGVLELGPGDRLAPLAAGGPEAPNP